MKSLKLLLPSVFLLFVFIFSPIISLAQTQTGIFKNGDVIKTKYAYNLHTAPGVVSSDYIMAGVQGTITAGPVYDLGVIWYVVSFETSMTGWITEPFIELSSQTTTTPPPTTTTLPTYSGCISFSPQAYTYMGPGTSNTQDVQKLQTFLLERGYLTPFDVIGGTGTFGPKTTSAVDLFLKDAGLGGATVGGTLASIHLKKIEAVSCSSSGVLWNSNPSISSGQATTLVWKISGNKDCILKSTPTDSNWSRGFMGTVTGTRNVNPTSTTNYQIQCFDPGFLGGIYTASGMTTVTVGGGATPPPTTGQAPTINLKANGSDGPVTLSSGQNLQLSWTVTPPTNPLCVLNIPSIGLFNSGIDPYGGMSPLDPNHPFYPKANSTVYTITCSNSAGSATDSVVVNISGTTGSTGTSTPSLPPTPMLPPPPTNTGTATNPTTSTNGNTRLSVSPGNVSAGSSVNLTWSSTAQSCVGMAGWSGPAGTSPWIGLKSQSGSQTVAVNYPTRFLLVCYQATSTGLQSTRAEVVVSVNGVGTDASVPRVLFTGN